MMSQLSDSFNAKMFFLFAFSNVAKKRYFIGIDIGNFETVAELYSSCVSLVLICCKGAVLKTNLLGS